MADITPPNPGELAPGWAGVLLSGVLVWILKPVGIAAAKAVGKLLSRVGVVWDPGQRQRSEYEKRLHQRIAELEQDVRERDALVLALTSDIATLSERVRSRDQDIRERDQQIAGLRRDLRAARAHHQGTGD